jgi:hypothetical protein
MTRMPGFSGEASLTRTNTQYSVAISGEDSPVVPARISCNVCREVCSLPHNSKNCRLCLSICIGPI